MSVSQENNNLPLSSPSIYENTYNNYQYAGFRWDPGAMKDGFNWTAEAGVVYKWILIGIESEHLKYRDGRPWFWRYGARVSGVAYPFKNKDWQFFIGGHGGVVTRGQNGSSLSTLFIGAHAEIRYAFHRHWGVSGKMSYDQRNDWDLLGWTVGWRMSNTVGLIFFF